MNRPRPSSLRLSTVALALMVLCLAVAARPAPTSDDALHEVMMGLKRHLKDLGRSVSDAAQNEQSLTSIAEMQALALQGKPLAPPNLDTVDRDKRPAHQAAFRADMARMLRELAQMEIDILEGRNADAVATIQGKLFELRDSSHDKYQEQH